MIVWLASYPRSGNTACRMLLNRAFGLNTWSLYDDVTDIGSNEAIAQLVGHCSHGRAQADFIAQAAASSHLHVVKTHDLPPAGGHWPVIVVVRDGRSALTSYWHYRNQFGQTAPLLEEVVAGAVQFGCWSGHVAAWLDAPHPRRLVLRYEDLAAPSAELVRSIGDFLGQPAVASPADLGFSAAQAASPTFFRAADDARNVAELEAACPALFNALHGAVQQRLGYSLATVGDEPAAALAAELGQVFAALRTMLGEERGRVAAAAAMASGRAEEAARLGEGVLPLQQVIARQGDDIRRLEAAALATQQQIAAEHGSLCWRLRGRVIRGLAALGLRGTDTGRG